MENFILWGVTADGAPERVSFLATRIQWPRIHRGTREMIDRMLADLDLAEIDYRDWSIGYFRSNYYTASGESPLDRDAWDETWEIALSIAQPAADRFRPRFRQLADRLDIVRTFARDETWDGGDPPAAALRVVVARFDDDQRFAQMRDAITALRAPGSPAAAQPDALAVVHDAQHWVVRTASEARELAIGLGMFDDDQFQAAGREPAQRLLAQIHALGGTATWDERAALTARRA